MRSGASKFIFALIIAALAVGWVYLRLDPSYTVENNLELNANYYPSITSERLEQR